MDKFGFNTPSHFSISKYSEEYKVTIPNSDTTCVEALSVCLCLLRLSGYHESSIKEALQELIDTYDD
jgi:hypothetical protein